MVCGLLFFLSFFPLARSSHWVQEWTLLLRGEIDFLFEMGIERFLWVSFLYWVFWDEGVYSVCIIFLLLGLFLILLDAFLSELVSVKMRCLFLRIRTHSIRTLGIDLSVTN